MIMYLQTCLRAGPDRTKRFFKEMGDASSVAYAVAFMFSHIMNNLFLFGVINNLVSESRDPTFDEWLRNVLTAARTQCPSSRPEMLLIRINSKYRFLKEIEVDFVPDDAFFLCYWLTKITVRDGVKCIGKRAFSGCSNLMSISIPDSVTSIGEDAFMNCKGLKNIRIPRGAKLEGNVFPDWTQVTYY